MSIGPVRWSRRRRLLLVGGALLLVSIVVVNALAWRHAVAMTTYRADGPRTARPEDLGTGARLRVLVEGVRLPRPRNELEPAAVGLAATSVRFSARDGVELEAWRIAALARDGGSRGVVLLFPGWGAARSSLLGPARELHELGWDCLLVDLRGCGGSVGERCTLGLREAEDVAAAAQVAATIDPRPPVLFGCSLGASALLRAVSELGVRPRGVIVEGCFARLREAVAARFRLMGLPASPGSELLLWWGGLDLGVDPWAHDPRAYAARVTCPALQLHGERDPTVSLEQARALQDGFAGPRQLVLFPGAGHESLLGRDPARWRAAVAAFLEGL